MSLVAWPIFKLRVEASMGTNVCLSVGLSVGLLVCLCVEKKEIQSSYWMFIKNSQVSIGEHQSISLYIEDTENRLCIEIMDDLSENAPARKWSCNKGTKR